MFFSVSLPFGSNAQEAAFKASQSSVNIELTGEILEEAEVKGITDDKIFSSFTMTLNCEIKDFKILRPAQLQSLNLLVEKDKEKIISQLKKVFECKGEREKKYQTPIAIHIN